MILDYKHVLMSNLLDMVVKSAFHFKKEDYIEMILWLMAQQDGLEPHEKALVNAYINFLSAEYEEYHTPSHNKKNN